MNPKALSRNALLIFVALFSLVIAIYLMPRLNPFFASSPHLTRAQARAVVEECLQRQKWNVEGFFCDALYLYDGSGLDYLMGTFGTNPIIALGREDRLPLSYWHFEFYRNDPKDQQRETFSFNVSPTGKLLGFGHNLPDSVARDSLSSAAAQQLAFQTLQSWLDIPASAFKLEQSSSIKKPKRTDYRFDFVRTAPELGEGAEVVEIKIAGNELTSGWHYFREPQNFTAVSGVVGSANILINVISVAVYLVLLFTVLVAFLRKYHEGEIGVRTGIWLGGIVFFTLVFSAANSWEHLGFGVGLGAISQFYTKLIQFGLQTVFGYNFIALMVMSSWTVGEQALRIDKPSLLSGVDSLFNFKWLSKNLGRELPLGFAFGAIAVGVTHLLGYVLIHTFGAIPRIGSGIGGGFGQYLPFYGMLVTIIMGALFDELVFRLFLITYLRRWLKSSAAAILLSALLYATFIIFFNDTYGFRASYQIMLPIFALGLIQGYVFWRYGLLAAMASIAFFSVTNQIGVLLSSPAPFFIGNAFAAILLLAGMLVVGLLALKRGETFEYTPEDEPAHIRRIKERVRLQKELEIAHRVQLGLLPKTNPTVSGFDIAGICIPALEVGGDYFDFVDLHEGNLGIAVGDVSGKGIPAAIYMTLTKGILQSHAGEDPSPKHVLSKVNSLMYRTIERNWYVSMFYAVLDSRRRLLRFARAGHNPGIIFRTGESQARLLQTAGIGLGLDPGEKFNRTLVEGELQISPGDTLVLYTDGFTEAMNSDTEEFGEERFLDILQRYKNSSASELVQHIIAAVREFVGEQPQHDDMTLVVLKALH